MLTGAVIARGKHQPEAISAELRPARGGRAARRPRPPLIHAAAADAPGLSSAGRTDPGRSALAGSWPASQRKARTASPAAAPTRSQGSHTATENSATTAGATTPGTVNEYWKAAR